MKFKIILLALTVCALVCVQARADFSQFGTFSEIDGHGPNGTYQTWEDFDFTDPTPADHAIPNIPADNDDNPYGTPTATIFAQLGVGDTPSELAGPVIAGGTVYAAPQMELRLWIPNVVNPDLVKIVQTTLRYHTNGGPGSGYVDAWLEPIGDSAGFLNPVAGVETTANDGWTRLIMEWQFYQICEAELITIQLYGNVLLDSIVVETHVPVPAAALLGLLGLAAAGRKFRKVR
jgi:hypothetical protein